MLSLADTMEQYAWLYQTKIPEPAGTWDHVIPTDGCYCAVKNVGGIQYVCFRGSVTFRDWLDDFDDFALPVDDPVLGHVHPGFRDGVLSVKPQLDALLSSNPVIVGHSLGAGHAAIYAGYCEARGLAVSQLLMFGEPRPGGPKLSGILAASAVTSYCNQDANGYDLVTAVPRALPPILNYQHVRDPLMACSAAPAPDDQWGPFRYHHYRLYAEALGADGPAIQAL